MPDQKTLRNYARLAIETGVNVQKGQLLVISCPVTHSDFAHLCMEEAYRCGAGEVWMNWADEDAERINLLYGEEAFLAKIPEYQLARVKEAQERKAAFLHIISPVPGIMICRKRPGTEQPSIFAASSRSIGSPSYPVFSR